MNFRQIRPRRVLAIAGLAVVSMAPALLQSGCDVRVTPSVRSSAGTGANANSAPDLRNLTIEQYEELLATHTRSGDPEVWSVIQNELGNAWSNLETGDRAANLSKALECYEAALEETMRDTRPDDWATTTTNIGNTWQDLPAEDRSANLARAIECYESALEVHTRADYPLKWASTQNNLGLAWRRLRTGDRAENLERAIACLQGAMQVQTRQADPLGWARAQVNLGATLLTLVEQPGRAEPGLIRSGIGCFKAALLVFTAAEHPERFAEISDALAQERQRYEAFNLHTGPGGVPFDEIPAAQ